MNDKEKHLKDWSKFLNAEEVKSNLVRASLYLFSYELLKNTVVDNIRSFYVQGFDGTKDIIGENYNIKVINRKIDGKQNIFLSSLYWLEENGVITKDDITEISIIREFRNTVAHQIDKILVDSDYNFDREKEKKMFDYIEKIERWWIREVEIPTSTDFDGKEILDEDIIPSKVIFYTYIKSITDELLKTGDIKSE